MVRIISLCDQDEGLIKRWYDASIDICNSHTIIYPRCTGFVKSIELIAELESIDIKDNKTVIYYKSGFYIVIVR